MVYDYEIFWGHDKLFMGQIWGIIWAILPSYTKKYGEIQVTQNSYQNRRIWPWVFVYPKTNPKMQIFEKKGSKTFSSKVLADILLQDLPELIPGNFRSIFRIVGHFLKIF